MNGKDHLRMKKESSTVRGLYLMDRCYGLLTAVDSLQIYHGYNSDFIAYMKMAWVRFTQTPRLNWKYNGVWQAICFGFPISIMIHKRQRKAINNWRKEAVEKMALENFKKN